MVMFSIGSELGFVFIKNPQFSFSGLDGFLEVSLSASESLDSLSGFLDFIGSMLNSGFIIFDFSVAFMCFGSESFIAFFLLSSKIGDHVSEETSNVVHWGVAAHLESDGVEKVLTEFGGINSFKSTDELFVAT